MTTITKERAKQIFLGIGDAPTACEERELARIALASLEAEPVAWRYRTTDINGNPKPRWSFSEDASLRGLYQPLYTAQPAPVLEPAISDNSVHDLFLLAKSLMYQSGGSPIEHSLNPVDAWLFEAERCNSEGATEKCSSNENVQEVPPELLWEDLCRISPEITIGDAIVYAGAWNACRAAMLQAAPLTGEDTSAELPEPCPRCGCRSSRPNGEHYCHPLAAAPQQEASND
ncbi:hypothetical protein DCF40_12680 [Edwardsiella piscicida]|uniref:hypothetical protein n=1 Tax=Edwardsiella piscicida TaxID=1263550 RepID=UPI00084C8E7F|nr:hypothetical protein [Edwardsiella piscicida]AOP43741.1 hypothetical protein A9797_12220 [Edwardsiella piscicida]EKS7766574.1 hypothetical protein [Edwardsiella piscicida]UCQ30343.1 hypothetical protein DCF74_12715 [Edwardsiella piscicida]UCQ56669.1 hypothetical protein DCF40_12680 [Edwardsiella piscicida]